jgi:hypothetical protein
VERKQQQQKTPNVSQFGCSKELRGFLCERRLKLTDKVSWIGESCLFSLSVPNYQRLQQGWLDFQKDL